MQHDTDHEDTSNPEARPEAALIRDFDASALIAHIQTTAENQKALLARELHDELGGLLVGAAMDLAWAEQHLSAPAADLRQKLVRARQTLAAAIDLKRKLIEDLRPTLLDNVGLFAALRWHLQATCSLGSMVCTITLPDEERRFLPHVPIALFRIVQEAFAIIVAQIHPAATDFTVTATDEALTLRFLSTLGTSDDTANGGLEPHALSAVRHRTAALGGVFSYGTEPGHGIRMTATFPLEAMLATA
jgi:signal transduction histidine kinase